MLECTGRPYSSLSVFSVYAQVPPTTAAFSYTWIWNLCGNRLKWRAQHSPAAPDPMMATCIVLSQLQELGVKGQLAIESSRTRGTYRPGRTISITAKNIHVWYSNGALLVWYRSVHRSVPVLKHYRTVKYMYLLICNRHNLLWFEQSASGCTRTVEKDLIQICMHKCPVSYL